jgi:hypothetical protein
MTNDKAKGSKPTHRILTVKKEADGKTTWTEIGAAWPNRNGGGFSLKFKVVPPIGEYVVMREASAKKVDPAASSEMA